MPIVKKLVPKKQVTNPDTQQLLDAVDQLIQQWDNYDNTGPLPADEIMERIRTIREAQKKEERERAAHIQIATAAFRLLVKLDNLTTDEFQVGGERVEREALREALAKVGL